MSCINCNTTQSVYEDICKNCRYDPSVVICKSDAKKKYNLTESDLNDINLFSINFTVHRNIGTKYLVSELEQLAIKLGRNKELCEYLTDCTNRKTSIVNNVTILIQKYELVIPDVDIIINQLAAKYYTNTDMDEHLISIAIINKIKEMDDKVLEKNIRKKKIDDYIGNNIDSHYKENAKSNYAYNQFINDTITYEECINTLNKLITQYTNKAQRICDLDEFITKHIDVKYNKIVKTHDAYDKYINNKIKYDTCIKHLHAYVNSIITKDTRIKLLHAELKKQKLKINDVKLLNPYIIYTQSDTITVETTLIDLKIVLGRKKRSLELETIMKAKKYINDWSKQTFYINYVNGDITLEKALEQLDIEINLYFTRPDRENELNEIIKEKKCKNIFLNKQFYIDYVNGAVPLHKTMTLLNEQIIFNEEKVPPIFNETLYLNPVQKLNAYIDSIVGYQYKHILRNHQICNKYINGIITLDILQSYLLTYKHTLISESEYNKYLTLWLSEYRGTTNVFGAPLLKKISHLCDNGTELIVSCKDKNVLLIADGLGLKICKTKENTTIKKPLGWLISNYV